MDECPVVAIAVSEFDIDKGNTLSSYWPARFDWSKFEESNVADLCLPDGGHLHTEDWTYIFLHVKPQVNQNPVAVANTAKARATKKVEPPRTGSVSGSASGASPTGGSGTTPNGSSILLNPAAVAELGARTRADSYAQSPRSVPSPRKPSPTDSADSHAADHEPSLHSSSPSSTSSNQDLIYGLAMFHNKADKSVRRGAIQKSLLLLSKSANFDAWIPILRASIIHIINEADKNGVKTLFEAIKAQWGQKTLSVFQQTFPLPSPTATLAPDEFGSASLKELVTRFGVDTMYLWYTMLMRQRILFSGQPAHLVGECCLACPLLVAPLQGFARNMTPYVALTDISPLERPHYICGSTNPIFETHTQRYDMMASFSTGIVRKSNAKLSTMDKEFILNVISGMSAKGEKWVRDQFFNYTKNFLDSVASNHYKSQQHRALGEPFRLSELYENYLIQLKNKEASGANVAAASTTAESLSSIVSQLSQFSAGKLQLTDAKSKQLLWDLLQKLVDLNTIDEVVEKDVLAFIAPMLDSNSAQVRKYAVAILAQVAISIKGQISLIQHNLIPRVVLMLRDPMPNVASAAAYCLFKISSLFIGVTALVQHRVPKMLLNIICSSEDNLTLKISTAETLLQIHRLDPTLPIVGHDNIRVMIRATSDATFRNVLLLLLDLWGEQRLPIKTNEEIEFHLASLRAGGLDVRTGATSMLLSSVAQDRNLLLQIIAAGGIQVIIKNLTQTAREEPLARLSMAILCLACDTAIGRSSLVGYGALPTVIQEFHVTDFPLHLYYVCRFCEVACQYTDTTQVFLENKGLDALVQAICKYAEKPSLQTLAMPCLGALKYLALLNPLLLHKHPQLVTAFLPAAELHKRVFNKAFDHLVQTGHPAVRTAVTPREAVLASASPDDREFYQLLHTVVEMWAPKSLEAANSPNKRPVGGSSPNNRAGATNKVDDDIFDDELRLVSEKLVTLLTAHGGTRRSISRRGTLGSPKAGLDAISEGDSEGSSSRRSSKAMTPKKLADEDIMDAADSLLADLDSPPKKSTTIITKIDLPKLSVASAVDAMDDGIDQLLADLANESMRSARSRSTTATEVDIMEAAERVLGDIESKPGKSSPSLLSSSSSVSPPPADLSGAGQSVSSPALTRVEAAAAKPTADDPEGFGAALGGLVPGAVASQAKRPRFVPELNVGDMWDDIADLTTSILAEVPSAPSTPTSAQGAMSEPGHASPLALSLDTVDPVPRKSSSKRLSLNLSSPTSSSFGDTGKPVSLKTASGTNSPVDSSPRSASSPTGDSVLRGASSPNATRKTSSPRKTVSSPRLTMDAISESSTSPRSGSDTGPKRDRSHSRKHSGDRNRSNRLSATLDDDLEKALEGITAPTSPRRRGNRRSIQITNQPNDEIPLRDSTSSATSSDTHTSESNEKKAIRRPSSSDLHASSVSAGSATLTSSSEVPSEEKKIRRKSSTKNAKEGMVEKDKKDEKHKEKEKEKEKSKDKDKDHDKEKKKDKKHKT